MSKKISLDGEIDPQVEMFNVISEYFSKGKMQEDLDSLTPKDRLMVMGKYAEFRWGKKQANAEDTQSDVNSTRELLEAVYEEIHDAKKQQS